MLAPSLEALLKFAAPGRTSQGGAAAWGFRDSKCQCRGREGFPCGCMQSPLGAALDPSFTLALFLLGKLAIMIPVRAARKAGWTQASDFLKGF